VYLHNAVYPILESRFSFYTQVSVQLIAFKVVEEFYRAKKIHAVHD